MPYDAILAKASDIIDLMFLIVNSEENIDIRRAAALVIANASSDAQNLVGAPTYVYMCTVCIYIYLQCESIYECKCNM